MRRLNPRRNDDGASLVLVAIGLVALLGVAALVLDYGAVAKEKRVVQNGADATALAVAIDCAKGACNPGQAAGFANQNRVGNDGSTTATACGSGPGLSACASPPPALSSKYVKVDAQTSGQVSYKFGQAVGAGSGKTVKASATAQWGSPRALATFPFVIGQCEITQAGGVPSAGDVTLQLRNGNGGKDVECQSGLPGGFGWVDAVAPGCTVNAAEGGSLSSKTGASIPKCLSGTDLAGLIGKLVPIPVFSAATGQGTNGAYTIAGFVGFRMLGYKLPGASSGLGCGNKCIIGKFERMVTYDGSWGGTSDYGVALVKLVA